MLTDRINQEELKDLYIVWSEYDECFDIKVRNGYEQGENTEDNDYIIGKIYETIDCCPLTDFIRRSIVAAQRNVSWESVT